MYPDLVKIGWFRIGSYGVFLALAFIAGIMLAMHRGKERNIPKKFVMDISIVIILSSLIGARFLYVIYHIDEFRNHWLDVISPFQSSGEFGIAGLTFLGGLMGALIASWVYSRMHQHHFLLVGDVVAPSIAAGITLVRIGCFLNGCCYGIPVEGSFLGVRFPPDCPAGAAFPGIAIYPAQLFSSLGGVIILTILLLVELKPRAVGFTLFLFLVLYGMHRIIIDFFRYYESSMIVADFSSFHISVNQVLSAVLVVVGITGIVYATWLQKTNIS